MKIDRFYQALVARRARAAWSMVATMVVLATAAPSSYGLEFPMTSLVEIEGDTTTIAAQLFHLKTLPRSMAQLI